MPAPTRPSRLPRPLPLRLPTLVLGLCLAALAIPAGAPAQLPLPVTCGGTNGSPPADQSEHFDVREENPLTPPADSLTRADYKAELETAYDTLANDTRYDWAPPPTADRIVVVITSGEDVVVTATPGDNPNTAWGDQDAQTVCIKLPRDFGAGDTSGARKALQGAAARTVTEALVRGIGALSGANAPDAAIAESAFAVMEDDIFGDADTELATLYPEFHDSLGEYDGAPRTQFLALRALSERFGRGVRGGAEALLQDFFEATSQGATGNLDSLNAALVGRGTTLGAAFHDYAVNARSMRPCSTDPTPRFCFAEAAKYVASDGMPGHHREIPSGPAQLQADIEDNYAIQYVTLPASGRFDLTVTNLSTGGSLRGTAVCTSGSQVLRVALPAPLGAAAAGTIDAFPPAGCTAPALVLSSGAHQVANPSSSTTRPYRVTLAAPTSRLDVSRNGTGTGTVTSDPAGIACGDDCTQRYPVGQKVLLTATPATDSVFTGWSGGCSGTETICTITVQGASTAVATFALRPPDPTPTPDPRPGAQPTPPPGLPSFQSPRVTDDTTAPKVRLDRLKRTGRGRKLTLRVTCPAAEANGCTGFVSLTARALGKNLKFGEQAFVALEAGDSETLTYDLTKRTRSVLDRVRRITIRASGRARDAAFNRATVTRSFVLRRAR